MVAMPTSTHKMHAHAHACALKSCKSKCNDLRGAGHGRRTTTDAFESAAPATVRDDGRNLWMHQKVNLSCDVNTDDSIRLPRRELLDTQKSVRCLHVSRRSMAY